MPRVLIWGFGLVALAVYLVMVLWSLPELARMAGGRQPFDLRPLGYDAEEAQAFLAALGAEGRSFYLTEQHRLDLVFPGLLGLTLILAYFRMAARPLALALSPLALAAAGFDWAENAAVAGLLRDPAPTEAMILAASRLSLLKSVCVSAAMTVLLLLLARAGWQALRRRPAAPRQ